MFYLEYSVYLRVLLLSWEGWKGWWVVEHRKNVKTENLIIPQKEEEETRLRDHKVRYRGLGLLSDTILGASPIFNFFEVANPLILQDELLYSPPPIHPLELIQLQLKLTEEEDGRS